MQMHVVILFQPALAVDKVVLTQMYLPDPESMYSHLECQVQIQLLMLRVIHQPRLL